MTELSYSCHMNQHCQVFSGSLWFSKKGMDKSRSKLESDGLTDIIGQSGPWHHGLWILTGLVTAFHSWQMLANKFLTYQVDHWCARPAGLQWMPHSQWLNLSAPLAPDGSSLDRCRVFDVDFEANEGIWERPAEDTVTTACTVWEYDTSVLQYTVVERWDLVCDYKSIPRLIQTVFFAGSFFGVLSGGSLSDRFGRRFTYMTFGSLWVLFTILGSVVPNVYLWTCTRFMCGATSLGLSSVVSVYATEQTHGKWRARVNEWYSFLPRHMGHLTLGGLAYVCQNMFYLEVIIGLSLVPCVLASFLLPESPRWLLAKGKHAEAKKAMKQACRINSRSMDSIDSFVDSYHETNQHDKHTNLADLFRFPGIRRNICILCVCWFSLNMSYYGLIMNTPSFDLNMFLVFVSSTFFTIPLTVALPYAQDLLGRKLCLTGALAVASLLMVSTYAFSEGDLAVVILAVIGLICATSAVSVSYTFTKELFPTVLRTTALGIASSSARVGSLVSPLIVLLADQDTIMPLAIYGLFGLLATLASVWIWPETKVLKLPDSLKACEAMSDSGSNTWLHFWSKTRTNVSSQSPTVPCKVPIKDTAA